MKKIKERPPGYWDHPSRAHKVKPPTIRQMTQRMRPSHTLGAVLMKPNPLGFLSDQDITIPGHRAIIENDRRDHSRARRDQVRVEANYGR